MGTVEPIKDYEHIIKMKEILGAKRPRDALLFSFGINSGLRISDIVALDVRDVKDKNYVEITERKTKKRKKFPINDKLKADIEAYVKDKPLDMPLFQTQKKSRMDRCYAYKLLNKAGKAAGVKTQIGTHTLRKTFGYHFYRQYGDLALLQKIFNHSSASITLRYIGIYQEDIDNAYMKFYL